MFLVMRDPDARYIGKDELSHLPHNGDGAAEVDLPPKNQVLKAFKQLNPTELLPAFSSDAKYMPKIVA